MKNRRFFFTALLLMAGCDSGPLYQPEQGADEHGHSPATEATAKANAAVAERLPLADQTDFENARRGLIESDDSLVIRRERDGKTVWNQDQYAFVSGDAPASVNPSLWRQAKLNGMHGLFKVTDRIYQIRGYDLANMSVIEGDTGLILIDPLTVEETAIAAMKMVRKHLGDKPITAILYTHSHVDHFGGVGGVLADQPTAENLRIIAPAGFSEEATSENVMAGVAMQRRASYQYGRRLGRGERGHVDLGLGKEVPFGGQIGFAEPTEIIHHTGQELTIDGLRFRFQFTPGSEAPAEFTFYLPELKAFCGAEVVSRNMHNVYTLRGAKVRDALRWSDYIAEMLELFGDAEIYFASHHWPLWGNQHIVEFLQNQRDGYKYLHDQSLRMANNGLTAREIAENLTLPAALETSFANRGYYGTVKHNAKAVYQFYFGWYDANPANLDPLPPVPAAQRYVKAIGGADAVLQQAQLAFDEGDYRWAAELLNHLVFADPEHQAGRALLAKVYDQLGYQAESGPWRDVYLSAAYELRHGGPDEGVNMTDAIGMLRAIPIEKFFDSMAARLNGPKAEGEAITVNFRFTDLGKGRHLQIRNAVMHHQALTSQQADVTLNITHELFLKLVTKQAGIKDTLFSDELSIEGNRLDLVKFFGLFDQPDGRFNIVTP